jgi:hypothetical protein
MDIVSNLKVLFDIFVPTFDSTKDVFRATYKNPTFDFFYEQLTCD